MMVFRLLFWIFRFSLIKPLLSYFVLYFYNATFFFFIFNPFIRRVLICGQNETQYLNFYININIIVINTIQNL